MHFPEEFSKIPLVRGMRCDAVCPLPALLISQREMYRMNRKTRTGKPFVDLVWANRRPTETAGGMICC